MGDIADRFPEELRHFVDEVKWTYAKTMPQWPHEYIVRQRVDEQLFVQLVNHIRLHGFEGQFYRQRFTYYEEDRLLYWTMGAPVDETTIVNRCRKEDSCEHRTKNGTLPESKSAQQQILELERRHAGGYARHSVQSQEFAVAESDLVRGDP